MLPTVLLTLLTASTASAAAGTLGFALGTKNADGSCKGQSDYEADFDAISAASGSKLVRGYSASDCDMASKILPAAKSKGFQVVLGVWPDVDTSLNADTAALKTWANQYPDQVYAVTVGSETMYRGNFTGAQLAEKISGVKAVLPNNVKVGTADSWNKYDDGTADDVIKSPDVTILLANAFAFWQGQDISNATATYFEDLRRAFDHIKSVAGDKEIEVWNGETGWPTTGGSDYGAAKASTDNADEYYHKALCGVLAWGFNAFYFEALDEPWKPASIGDNGLAADETHWGAMTADRKSKFSLKC